MIVESGLGVTGAESYLTVADADALVASYGMSDEWATFTVASKEIYLKKASLEIDKLLTWTSKLLSTDQGLEFPREPFYDKSGRYVEGIPDVFKRSVAEIAVAISNGNGEHDARLLTQETFGDSSSKFASPVLDGDTTYHDVRAHLARLGYGRSASRSVEIFRA